MLGKVFKQNYVMLPFACGTTNCQQLLSNVSTNINSKVNIKKCMYYHRANTVISPNFMVWKFCGLDDVKLEVEAIKVFYHWGERKRLSYIQSLPYLFNSNILFRRPSRGFHNMPGTLQRGVKKSLGVVFL